jgi:hypothetical protein
MISEHPLRFFISWWKDERLLGLDTSGQALSLWFGPYNVGIFLRPS